MRKVITTGAPYGFDEWDLTTELRKLVSPLARRFGLSVEETLKQISGWRLAGNSFPSSVGEVRDPSLPGEPPVGFSVTLGDDKELAGRVQRGAAFDKVTVPQFVWAAVTSFIECAEEAMIIDPKTRDAVANRVEFDDYRRRHVLHAADRVEK